MRVEFVEPDGFESALRSKCDVVLDSIFGFSFHGEPREPFRSALEAIIREKKSGVDQSKTQVPVVSVDIPSSWNVDDGSDCSDISRSFTPDVLISLTAPKLGSRDFTGKHWLGGRFVDAEQDKKYNLCLPKYPDTSQVVDITGAQPRAGD